VSEEGSDGKQARVGTRRRKSQTHGDLLEETVDGRLIKASERHKKVRHPAMVRLMQNQLVQDEQQRKHHAEIRARRTPLEQGSYDGLEEFRLFLNELGNSALKDETLLEHDSRDLKTGLSTLNNSIYDLLFVLELLEGSAGAPGCASLEVMHIWGAIIGAFLIGQFGTISESAERHFNDLFQKQRR